MKKITSTMELAGKKLLVLGGTYNDRDIRDYADKMGIILCSTGKMKSPPLSHISNMTFDSGVSLSELEQLVAEKKIDGVFTGGNEQIISTIIDLSERTGLPFYATRKQWDITGNKRAFKNACIASGLPVVPEFVVSKNPTEEEFAKIEYPVVVKPIDGCGARGVILCHNQDELKEAIPLSKSFSDTETVIVEKYMTGYVVIFYITAIDGEYFPASMCDKYTDPQTPMHTIAQVHMYPSRQLNLCLEKYLTNIKILLKHIGIKNGVVGIQGFCDDKQIIFTEMGYRLGGTSQQNYTKAINNYSNMELLMNYALTGKMTDEPCMENPHFNKKCATLSISNKGGTIGRMEGVKEVSMMPEVYSCENRYKVGDIIPVANNISMIQFRVFVIAEDTQHLKASIKRIQETLKVYDIDGKYMLQDNFDVERLDATPLGKME